MSRRTRRSPSCSVRRTGRRRHPPGRVRNPSRGRLPTCERPPAGSSRRADPLAFLRTQPQFQQLRQLVRSNPQLLEPLLLQLGQQNPQLLMVRVAGACRCGAAGAVTLADAPAAD